MILTLIHITEYSYRDANVDLKPIFSIYIALQYISKYTSKTEPSSLAFSEIFKQILNNSNPDNSLLFLIQKLLFNSISEHDISAQETCHLLNGTAKSFLCTGSRNNVEDTGRTTQSALKRYWERPEELEDYSLFELYLIDQWEAYCRVKVLLHIRHCNMQVLMENGNINWSTLYDQHIDTINDASQDLLRQPVNDKEVYDEESEDELPFKEDEDEDEEQYTYDWMWLMKMGLKAIIHYASDLSSRDMNRNHNWITDAQQNYSNNNIASVDEFIKNTSNSGILDRRKVDIDLIDYRKLNENQKKYSRK
ncbi:hypothetical protein RhiirC2_782186 [Rhizophagus irregularis]|uniref:Uncharacterized protein n=1 Tax=Rhizophagus irregularis TaxID=588596 RepID=A0A2N1N3Q0_9GLOM|nr:hypothetical protein RhiirC2_782186 [Rhizophagus irregularis]